MYQYQNIKNAYTENYSTTITNCNIITDIINKIQTQLNSAFQANTPCGPITFKMETQTVSGPPISDFTQSLTSIQLPDYLAFNSSQASIINSQSTWGSIFVSIAPNNTNPLLINLTKQVDKVISSQGYPACSNEFLTVDSLSMGGITIKGFNTLTIKTTTPSQCLNIYQNKQLFPSGKQISYPFIMNVTLNLNVPVTGNGKGYSSYCGIASSNPLSSNFYKCANLNNPCKNDVLLLSTVNVNGSVSGPVVLTITGDLNFTINESDSNLSINNINISNVNYDLNGSAITANINVHYNILSLIGGQKQVQQNLMKYVNQMFSKLIPGLVNSLNSYLKTQNLSYNL
jgi:hypothetical protein